MLFTRLIWLGTALLCFAARTVAQPVNLRANFNESGNVHLDWSVVAGAEIYRIYHSSDPLVPVGPGTLLAESDDAFFDHFGALDGTGNLNSTTHHFYRVSALTGGEEGTASNTFGVFRGPDGPGFNGYVWFTPPLNRPAGEEWRASRVVKSFLLEPNSAVIDLTDYSPPYGGLSFMATLSGVPLGALDVPNGMQVAGAYIVDTSLESPLWVSGEVLLPSALTVVIPPPCTPGLTFHGFPVGAGGIVVCSRTSCSLLTSGFLGGTASTSDRVVDTVTGVSFYRRNGDQTWQGTLVLC